MAKDRFDQFKRRHSSPFVSPEKLKKLEKAYGEFRSQKQSDLAWKNADSSLVPEYVAPPKAAKPKIKQPELDQNDWGQGFPNSRRRGRTEV